MVERRDLTMSRLRIPRMTLVLQSGVVDRLHPTVQKRGNPVSRMPCLAEGADQQGCRDRSLEKHF